MGKGFLIAAPHSGSGKTTITLGLLRALKRRGIAVCPAKAGPDFIDPKFHEAACGVECINLDPWGMRQDTILSLAAGRSGHLIVEGMMGLFDGAADGTGSAADLATLLKLPVVLIVDAAKQSHSIAALVAGFRNYRKDIRIAGVILNQVGSFRHEAMLREALALIDMRVFGVILRNSNLALPSRHLGLVQAQEHGDLERFLDAAADAVESSVEIDQLIALDRGSPSIATATSVAPLGQRIAVARDQAFAFSYPHLINGWQEQGAEVCFFSPLNDEAPDADCDSVYLPGGYPELHGGTLSSNEGFLDGLRIAASNGAFVYGECGGYMVLGEGVVDSDGVRHEMAGLLPLVTSFEKRKLHLGYRNARLLNDIPIGQKNSVLACHEFHYSTVVKEGCADRLFTVEDARGEELGNCGLRVGNVAGSYMHVIDRRN